MQRFKAKWTQHDDYNHKILYKKKLNNFEQFKSMEFGEKTEGSMRNPKLGGQKNNRPIIQQNQLR